VKRFSRRSWGERRRNRQRGGETVEFALTLVLWFTVFVLIIDMAVAFYDKGALTNASRYAARQATVFWVDPLNYDDTTPIANMRLKRSMVDTAAAYWASTVIAPRGGQLTPTTQVTGNRGQVGAGANTVWIGMADATATVDVSYDHDYIGLTGLLGPIFGVMSSEVTGNSEARL
jgi:Flp pilus assembly protein TadG